MEDIDYHIQVTREKIVEIRQRLMDLANESVSKAAHHRLVSKNSNEKLLHLQSDLNNHINQKENFQRLFLQEHEDRCWAVHGSFRAAFVTQQLIDERTRQFKFHWDHEKPAHMRAFQESYDKKLQSLQEEIEQHESYLREIDQYKKDCQEESHRCMSTLHDLELSLKELEDVREALQTAMGSCTSNHVSPEIPNEIEEVRPPTATRRGRPRRTDVDKAPKKQKISIKLKRAVWDAHFGPLIGTARCPCCEDTLIRQIEFHCGHKVPESRGGSTTVDNLVPICAQCNLSMGTSLFEDFKKSLQPKSSINK